MLLALLTAALVVASLGVPRGSSGEGPGPIAPVAGSPAASGQGGSDGSDDGAGPGGRGMSGSGSGTDSSRGPDDRPNVVFVLTDDMRADDLRWMPYTSRLFAERGMEFTDAVSPHPLCCPARAQLVTGQYAQNNGVQHNRGDWGGYQAMDPDRTVSEWFEDAGYATAFVGKFLNGYTVGTSRPDGWSHWDPLVRGVYDYVDFWFADDGGAPAKFTDSYVTDVIAERTDDVVRSLAASDRPFLLYSWHLAPHYRIRSTGGKTVPPSIGADRHRFAHTRPPTLDAPSFNRTDPSQPRIFQRAPRSVVEVKRDFRARIRSLQAVDRAVRSLVDTLRSTGELDDTYLVFSSDNGYSLGERRFIGKNVLTEEVLRVPLLVLGPGVEPGTTSSLPASLVDLPATFAALSGVSPSRQVDGQSLAAALSGGGDDDRFRDTTLVQTGSTEGDGWAYRGVRTDRYLYGLRGPGDGFLYDDERDPYEQVNRFSDPDYADVLAELERRRMALVSCAGWTCNQSFGGLVEPGGSTSGR